MQCALTSAPRAPTSHEHHIQRLFKDFPCTITLKFRDPTWHSLETGISVNYCQSSENFYNENYQALQRLTENERERDGLKHEGYSVVLSQVMAEDSRRRGTAVKYLNNFYFYSCTKLTLKNPNGEQVLQKEADGLQLGLTDVSLQINDTSGDIKEGKKWFTHG